MESEWMHCGCLRWRWVLILNATFLFGIIYCSFIKLHVNLLPFLSSHLRSARLYEFWVLIKFPDCRIFDHLNMYVCIRWSCFYITPTWTWLKAIGLKQVERRMIIYLRYCICRAVIHPEFKCTRLSLKPQCSDISHLTFISSKSSHLCSPENKFFARIRRIQPSCLPIQSLQWFLVMWCLQSQNIFKLNFYLHLLLATAAFVASHDENDHSICN